VAEVTDALRHEVRIDARPETVFPYFTDPGRIVRWKGREAELEPQPGGIYRVVIRDGQVARGEYVEVTPYTRVVFTWGWEDGAFAPGTSTVEIDLVPDGEGTIVRLTHTDLPAEERDLHDRGWSHYLSRLAVAAAGGDPGPDPLGREDASLR
jgi:uncharacterized protein YndB with AHSA1/START domain